MSFKLRGVNIEHLQDMNNDPVSDFGGPFTLDYITVDGKTNVINIK